MSRFVRALAPAIAALALGACATVPAATVPAATGPVEVKLIAFNDFHGNLQPPRVSVPAALADGSSVRVPAGGAAYLASAIASLKAKNPNHAVVAAGDMIGASPLASALFLDEPTIAAMNLIDIDFNAVGNHEFDKGKEELLRMQKGGCEKHTPRIPCAVEPFRGAAFQFLAANVRTSDGGTVLPAWGMRSFGRGKSEVKIGFIGMTTKSTPTLVTPAGIAGLTFADEAETVNALVPTLKAQGADAIVVLVHEGASTSGLYNDKSCPGLAGDLVPILKRLDPAVDVVVSGHTHRAYVCDFGAVDPSRPFLLTSAAAHGTMVTDIRLAIDPATGRVTSKAADNIIVQGEGFANTAGDVPLQPGFQRFDPDPAVTALVERYVAAAAPAAARPVGRLSGPALRESNDHGEQVLGNLIADAQLAATRAPSAGGAEIAFMNSGGVRADLVPATDGSVTFGQLFAIQPFGNTVTVKTFTGRQIRALLEQQFAGPHSIEKPYLLLVSEGFSYGYDLSKPAGQRIVDPRLNGRPLEDDRTYRVTASSFLASGGDGFTVLREGTDPLGGPADLDALEAHIASGSPRAVPAAGRIRNLTPR